MSPSNHTATTSGRVVVVTGGTRGIGLGLVRELLARGCGVAFCGRSADAVDTALGQLGDAAAAGRALGVVADVTSREDLQRLWNRAVEAFGRVDVWVNNAGVSLARASLWEVDETAARRVVETNLLGVVNGSSVAIAGMIEQGSGRVWNMEGFGSNGMKRPGLAAYGASKRAVTYLTDALAKEVDDTPVRVGHLSPGIVVTDLLVGDYVNEPAELEKAKKVFNILGDRVETVTPFLAEGVLGDHRNGARVAWLTRTKAAGRFATAAFRKRDLFEAAADVPQEARA